jgi:hypothetical protein
MLLTILFLCKHTCNLLVGKYIHDLTYMLSTYIYVSGLSDEACLFSLLIKLVLHASNQINCITVHVALIFQYS